MFVKSKHTVTLLNDNWEIIKDKIHLSSIPKKDELIYIDDIKTYYRIISVIHRLQPKHNIILVLKEYPI